MIRALQFASAEDYADWLSKNMNTALLSVVHQYNSEDREWKTMVLYKSEVEVPQFALPASAIVKQ